MAAFEGIPNVEIVVRDEGEFEFEEFYPVY